MAHPLPRSRARPAIAGAVVSLLAAAAVRNATAETRRPDGASVLRLLGPNAGIALAPASRQVSAFVAIPPGQTAASLGVESVVDGVGRVRGAPAILAFADAHP